MRLSQSHQQRSGRSLALQQRRRGANILKPMKAGLDSSSAVLSSTWRVLLPLWAGRCGLGFGCWGPHAAMQAADVENEACKRHRAFGTLPLGCAPRAPPNTRSALLNKHLQAQAPRPSAGALAQQHIIGWSRCLELEL
eukprot:821935-Amphidinium_carterae.1